MTIVNSLSFSHFRRLKIRPPLFAIQPRERHQVLSTSAAIDKPFGSDGKAVVDFGATYSVGALAVARYNTDGTYDDRDIATFLQAEKAAGHTIINLALIGHDRTNVVQSFISRNGATLQPRLVAW